MVHMIFSFLLLADVAATGIASDYDYDVARAARTFRIEVYNTFRQDREEYDLRQAAGEEVMTIWKKSAGTKEDADRLIQWFHEATEASRPDAGAAMPSFPDSVRTAQSASSNENSVAAADLNPGSTTDAKSVLNAPQTPNAADIELPPSTNSGTGVLDGLSRALLNAAAAPRTPAPTADAVAETTPNETAELSETANEIDYDELKARVDGYNSALAAVNQQLTDDSPLTSESLLPIVEELTDLVQRHHDLNSYLRLEGHSNAELRNVGELLSPAPTISSLSQRVTEARSKLEQSGGGNSGGSDPAEIDRLHQLSIRLSELENRQ